MAPAGDGAVLARPAGACAVNIVAVVWGVGMAINLGWPRAKVFGTDWYLQYFPELFLGGALLVGALAYLRAAGAESPAGRRARPGRRLPTGSRVRRQARDRALLDRTTSPAAPPGRVLLRAGPACCGSPPLDDGANCSHAASSPPATRSTG